MGPPGSLYKGLQTLQASLAHGVCTQVREILTEAEVGVAKRRAASQMDTLFPQHPAELSFAQALHTAGGALDVTPSFVCRRTWRHLGETRDSDAGSWWHPQRRSVWNGRSFTSVLTAPQTFNALSHCMPVMMQYLTSSLFRCEAALHISPHVDRDSTPCIMFGCNTNNKSPCHLHHLAGWLERTGSRVLQWLIFTGLSSPVSPTGSESYRGLSMLHFE